MMPQPEDRAPDLDDILDDLFHGCAFAAYAELAAACGGEPDMEATRRLAFQYYEEELAKKNGGKPTQVSSDESPSLGCCSITPRGDKNRGQ
jgi:hypothetical protein